MRSNGEGQAKATAEMARSREATVISPPTTETAADSPDRNINKHIGDITVDLSTNSPKNPHGSTTKFTGDGINGNIMANMDNS